MAQFSIPKRDQTKEMRYQMGYALADLANEYENIITVDADLHSSSGLHIFEPYHPDKLVKVGIVEHNQVIARTIHSAQSREDIDVVVLAQLSMSVFSFSYPKSVKAFGIPVLNSD